MTYKQAIRAADKAFSEYIRARDPRCITCGAPTSDCSHIFRRHHHSTRWLETNAVGQCRRCHMIHHNGTESYLLDVVRYKMGGIRFEELRNQWEGISDFKTYQLEELTKYFETKLANIRAKNAVGVSR